MCLPPPFQKTARPQCSQQQLCVRLEGAVARHPEDTPPPGFCVAWAWADPGELCCLSVRGSGASAGVGKTQGAEGARSPPDLGSGGGVCDSTPREAALLTLTDSQS